MARFFHGSPDLWTLERDGGGYRCLYRPVEYINERTMNTIIITGGAGALGSAVTQNLLEKNYKCVVPYRSETEAQALRAASRPDRRDQLLLLEADLLNDAEVERVVDAAASYGDLHGLVHLLGGVKGFQPIAETDPEDWDFLMNLNLRSYFMIGRLVMQKLKERGSGRIVGIASMQGIKPTAGSAGNGVAKAGVIALTKILADEGRDYGVTANAVAPGIIPPRLCDADESARAPGRWATSRQAAELGRSGKPHTLHRSARIRHGEQPDRGLPGRD